MISRDYRFPNSASGDVISYSVTFPDAQAARNAQGTYGSLPFIEQMIRSSVIYPRFRIFLLNQDETVNRQIPPEDILSGGSYQENYQNGQRRSLSMTLLNEDGKYTPSANSEFWFNRKFLLEIGMQVSQDDDTTIWFKKGVYVVTNAKPSESPEKKTISYELSDKFNILEGKTGTIPMSYSVPVGTNIEDVLTDLLLYNNGDGYPLDPKPMLYHSKFKGRVTTQTITEGAGATWGSVVLKIIEMLSAECFYNTEGQLVIVPKIDMMSDGDKPVLFQYFKGEGDFTENGIDLKMTEVVNRVVVIGANVNSATCQAISVNDNASSPICYQRIGYRTANIINDTNITSEILAKERADYELRKQTIQQTSISNSVFFNPLLEVNNLITVTDDFYDFQQERLLLQSISYSLDYNGMMSISTTNINNLPFITR